MARNGDDRPVTIKDIANHLGIAFSTVSRALHGKRHVSEEVRKKVEKAAAELGYVPNKGARMLHGEHGNIVGLVIPDFRNQLFWATSRILAERCNEAGYELMLCVSGDDPETELKQVMALRSARAAGIIIAASGHTLDRTKRLLEGGAVVQLAGRNPSLPCQTVSTNDRLSILSSTRHLIQLGHRQIGYIGGPIGLGTAEERFAGYSQALAEAGIQVEGMHVQRGPLEIEFARLAMTRLLQATPKLTGVVMSNSLQTEGAISAVIDAGISIPKDISLIGYGDPGWFQLWGPGITTIDAREAELADTAATLLMDQISHSELRETADRSVKVQFNTRIILRGTTGPPQN